MVGGSGSGGANRETKRLSIPGCAACDQPLPKARARHPMPKAKLKAAAYLGAVIRLQQIDCSGSSINERSSTPQSIREQLAVTWSLLLAYLCIDQRSEFVSIPNPTDLDLSPHHRRGKIDGPPCFYPSPTRSSSSISIVRRLVVTPNVSIQLASSHRWRR